LTTYSPKQEMWAGEVGAEISAPWSSLGPPPPCELPATSIR
jgi:hypothetical protein